MISQMKSELDATKEVCMKPNPFPTFCAPSSISHFSSWIYF